MPHNSHTSSDLPLPVLIMDIRHETSGAVIGGRLVFCTFRKLKKLSQKGGQVLLLIEDVKGSKQSRQGKFSFWETLMVAIAGHALPAYMALLNSSCLRNTNTSTPISVEIT